MSLPILITFDGLSGVDGSARFSFGNTTAIASVSGPIPARLAAEHPVRATVDVHLRPLTSVPGTTEKRAAGSLKGILERVCILAHNPRTLIQVVVQALSPSSVPSSRGSDPDVLLAVEINACMLALLSAGSIPMRGVVCAVAVAASTADQLRPHLVTGGDTNTQLMHSGCFAFLLGIDQNSSGQNNSIDMDTDGPIPPSKMIWTNYRAVQGNAYSSMDISEAEKVASEGATAVWKEMKERLGASSFAGIPHHERDV